MSRKKKIDYEYTEEPTRNILEGKKKMAALCGSGDSKDGATNGSVAQMLGSGSTTGGGPIRFKLQL